LLDCKRWPISSTPPINAVATQFLKLLQALLDCRVEFVVIGGVAMVLRGSGRVTADLDVCYSREASNVSRLADALAPLHPRLRGAPPELPFIWDSRTIASGLNFTLRTDLGDLDVLGEVSGVGEYDHALKLASPLTLDQLTVNTLTLEGLEKSKRAAGRAKDLLDLEELRELRRQA
jgi:hypothetical protein